MSEKKRIFIVDDEEVALTSLKELLALSGFEVEATQNAKEIIQKIKAFRPHLILLDLLLPDTGGLEICAMLNQDKETQGIAIIVVSGLVKDEDIKKAYQSGVIGYVSKPYDFKKLLQEINKAIDCKWG